MGMLHILTTTNITTIIIRMSILHLRRELCFQTTHRCQVQFGLPILGHHSQLSASARQRESPYPLFKLEDAIDTVLKEITPLPALDVAVRASIAGHVLAEDVFAPADVPASQTTSVDGYALRGREILS